MFFGVEVPRSSNITVKVRFVTGRGQPFVAWQGSADANEADVLQAICESPIVCSYIKKAAANKRLKPDEDGAFRIPAKIVCIEDGQVVKEDPTVVIVYPLWNGGDAESMSGGNVIALDVIKTLVDSVTNKEEHLKHLIDTTSKLQDSYQKAIAAVSQHSLSAMDKVSGHASGAFSAAAAPFADMSKSLVKALDDSRSQSANSAKEANELLIQALKNRIIEGGQTQKTSIADDIKEVLGLWPSIKGLLGDPETKPQP